MKGSKVSHSLCCSANGAARHRCCDYRVLGVPELIIVHWRVGSVPVLAGCESRVSCKADVCLLVGRVTILGRLTGGSKELQS